MSPNAYKVPHEPVVRDSLQCGEGGRGSSPELKIEGLDWR